MTSEQKQKNMVPWRWYSCDGTKLYLVYFLIQLLFQIGFGGSISGIKAVQHDVSQ